MKTGVNQSSQQLAINTILRQKKRNSVYTHILLLFNEKANVELCPCLIKHLVMKEHGEWRYSPTHSAVDGREYTASRINMISSYT
jgi:hypothetical protein